MTCGSSFFGYLLNYLLLSTLTATVTTSETASANAAKVINKKLVSNVTIINFLSLKNIFVILKPMQRYVCLRTQPNVLHKSSKKIGILWHVSIKINMINIWFFVRFALSLASPKVLPFGNKNKSWFILYFAHLFLPLHPWIWKL